MYYFEALGGFIKFSSDDIYSALTNTLVGICTVFLALIVISLIISCFSLIPKIQGLFEKKKEVTPVTSNTIDNVVNGLIEQETESLSDDTELVAVITAAIMAYLGDAAPSDGLVVRSIRRR